MSLIDNFLNKCRFEIGFVPDYEIHDGFIKIIGSESNFYIPISMLKDETSYQNFYREIVRCYDHDSRTTG